MIFSCEAVQADPACSIALQCKAIRGSRLPAVSILNISPSEIQLSYLPMKVLRAAHLGMCFGVRDAITLARDEAARAPVTVLGDLVHNDSVLSDLRERGVRLEQSLDAVTTPTVMITAHGASERRIDQIVQRGHRIIEATCPLVRFAHQRVASLVRDGFHPVIVGQRHHVEVVGLTEDLAEFDVILEDADVEKLTARLKFGVAAQTTQPLARVERLLGLMRSRFPNSEIRFADTVCLPTKRRQLAAVEIAVASSVVVVVGGARSNNTRELVETCRKSCGRVWHVQTAADLKREWFRANDIVGITAGTSTPDGIIESVEAWLQRLAAELAVASNKASVEPLLCATP